MQKLKTTITLEVERKFAGFKQGSLALRQGHPPIRNLRDLGQSTFHDIYYDDRDLLSRSGVWLRMRDGKWQMKVGKNVDRLNSRLQEISDHETIAQKIQSLTGQRTPQASNFGLSPLASFRTTRHSWLADDEFTLVLDRTDFGHTVGEVELEVNTTVQDNDEAEKIMTEMDMRIVNFIERHQDVFSEDAPVGKLTAYLAQAGRQNT